MTATPMRGITVSVALDGSGNGTAKIGPQTAREVWKPANVHVSVQIPVVNEAQCKIYVGSSVNAQSFRDGTLSGSTGDTSDAVSADIIESSSFIWAVWTGGDANRQATMNVTGIKDI
jgi:hypothetical protein